MSIRTTLIGLLAVSAFGRTAPPSPQKVALSISLTAADAIAKKGAAALKKLYHKTKAKKP
jgi:hypothetical protein